MINPISSKKRVQTYMLRPGPGGESCCQRCYRVYDDDVSVGQKESGCIGELSVPKELDLAVYSGDILEEN